MEAKREYIILESNLEVQTRKNNEELVKLQTKLDLETSEMRKKESSLLLSLDTKNKLISELEEKISFLIVKLQFAESPINKESRGAMAERIILLAAENDRLQSKIKVLIEEKTNMARNFELELTKMQV